MLTIEFECRSETLKDPDVIRPAAVFFDMNCTEEWLQDDMIGKMIESVDKSKLEGLRVVSPVLGDISIRDLSGGCKTLITMYNIPEAKYMSHELGDNCIKWVFEIAKIKDVTLVYSSYFPIPLECEPFDVKIANDGTVIHTMLELVDKKLELCDYM